VKDVVNMAINVDHQKLLPLAFEASAMLIGSRKSKK
jgi:hypothetical protein